jgi:hypothetical protein
MLWVMLASVSDGDWRKQSPAWQDAAARWRDNYFDALKERELMSENFHETYDRCAAEPTLTPYGREQLNQAERLTGGCLSTCQEAQPRQIQPNFIYPEPLGDGTHRVTDNTYNTTDPWVADLWESELPSPVAPDLPTDVTIFLSVTPGSSILQTLLDEREKVDSQIRDQYEFLETLERKQQRLNELIWEAEFGSV